MNRRLLAVAAMLVGVVAGATALAVRLTASPGSAAANVALVATTPASLGKALDVTDVHLLAPGADVPLLTGATRTATVAPQLGDLGTYTVAPGHYTKVAATIGGNARTANADITVSSGGLLPVLIVTAADSISVAAGNDEVNHATLVAAGTLIHPPAVSFVDQHGAPVPLSGLKGRVVVAAALDTHCHDTCPLYTAIWADLQSVIRERGWGDRVVIAEISMDPDRDTPAELDAYARLTGASWPLLRTDVASTFQFWLALHAGYTKAAPPSPAPTDWYTGRPETYHLDHDSVAVVFDQNGDARYLLQGNPQLGHTLSPALQALLDPKKARQIAQRSSWSLRDLLDRVDTLLGLPTERDRAPAEQATRPGSRPPDFTLHTPDGRAVQLSAQAGRPIVVTFWATWCAPCRKDFPALVGAVRQHPGLQVIAVNEGESATDVRDFLRQVLDGDSTAVIPLLDGDKSVGGRYAAQALPVTVFVGADGIVQSVRVGQLQPDDLTTALARIGA